MGKSSDKFSDTPFKTALGLMSGTSLDGVDAAIINTDGERIADFGATAFRPYTNHERDILYQASQAALKWNFKGRWPDIFKTAEAVLHTAHFEAAKAIWPNNSDENIDIVGFHGQTLIHRPPKSGESGASLQIGDGQALADALGVDVVFDFRSNDIKSGGQGAPLVPIYHKALVAKAGLSLPTAIVNIGGVSNLTLVDENGLWATDCGPGNGPLDDWIKNCGLGDYDESGKLSLAGSPDFALIEKWLSAPFFAEALPKSADRHDFAVLADLSGKSPEDGAATLSAFTARAIAFSLQAYASTPESLIIAGGGRHNKAIMSALELEKIGAVINADKLGWAGDALEAQAFAFLAVRHKYALPLSLPSTTGVSRPMCGGELSNPQNR